MKEFSLKTEINMCMQAHTQSILHWW